MDRLDKEKGLGEGLTDQYSASLKELRKIRKQMSKPHERCEIFDPGFRIGLGSERTVEGKIERLTRACIWHAVCLKAEFKIKLLYTIDGYLSAVNAANPVSIFLSARYLLELAAILSAIDVQLDACVNIDFRDWKHRGFAFLAPLLMARHSTSDPSHEAILLKIYNEIPTRMYKPIRIGKAIKQLASRSGFEAAVSTYDTLSNICHHNGSSHVYLRESGRMTKVIAAPDGTRILFKNKVAAITMGYPAPKFLTWSLRLTAPAACWCAYSSDKIIEEMRATPFSDDELKALTDGQLTNDEAAYPTIRAPRPVKGAKVGRNDPCPCGSGKKYKACCLAATDDSLPRMLLSP